MAGYARAFVGPRTWAAAAGSIKLAGAIAGVGTLTGRIIRQTTPVSADQWLRQYSVSGGAYVSPVDSKITRLTPLTCGVQATTITAKVFRGTFQYTSIAGDIGKTVAFYGKVSAAVGAPNTIDVSFASSALTSQFAMTGGTQIGTILSTDPGNQLIPAGFTFTAAGQTVTFYWQMELDTTTMIAVVGNFNNSHSFTNVGYSLY